MRILFRFKADSRRAVSAFSYLMVKLPFTKARHCPVPTAAEMPSGILAYAMMMAGRHQFFISCVSAGIAAISVAPIALQKDIVNEAIEARDLDLLIWLCSLFLVVIVTRLTLKYVLGVYQNWIAESVIRCEREHLSNAYAQDEDPETKLRQSDAADTETEKAGAKGTAVSVINSEIDFVGKFVGTGISDLVADGGKLLFGIGYMIWVEPLLAVVATAFILPQLIIVPLLQRVLNRLIRERTDQLRDLSSDIADMQQGATELEEDYTGLLDDIFTNRIKAAMVKFLTKQLVNFLNSLAPLSVLAFGGYLYIQGQTSIGIIVAFTSGFAQVSGPLRAMVNYYRLASVRNEQYDKIKSWKMALNC